jgi:acyl-CoA synthetase (AMP-forming)/AMP-acid ligase II
MASQLEATVARLNALGIGRGDRVAIVLPNGAETALAVLSIASGAVAAPLNPAYRAAEFEFYLGDLRPKALVCAAGQESPARAVAAAQAIPVLDLMPLESAAAGLFRLDRAAGKAAEMAGLAQPDDPALLLHTSGTTSRPKLVVLTHANLCASARNIAASLQLTAEDRCLNVMPLFHIHGLMGALLSSLSVGASVVCTTGFAADHFYSWMDEFAPSWYSAVPTMHQALLSAAAGHADTIARRPLRFIRSCSAALPLRVMSELEAAFGVPVVEAYGMTEASHQMTTNPLPPRNRKPGSVGVPASVEVAILDEGGTLLPPEVEGEVGIRGESVTAGYDNNPAANAAAFTNGWFRTGDQGRLDSEGYLFLTGRMKEMINRGGEKLSPREIDDVLLQHPAVAQALTFAIPHPTLGQDAAAAIVLRPNVPATREQLHEFALERLADFKVPRRIVFVEELPKGPTGKLQRIGMAEKLGLLAEDRAARHAANYEAPASELERELAFIWSELLQVERVGVHDDFFELGGDSLLAAQAVTRAGERLGVDPERMSLFETPTIAALSQMFAKAKAAAGGR